MKNINVTSMIPLQMIHTKGFIDAMLSKAVRASSDTTEISQRLANERPIGFQLTDNTLDIYFSMTTNTKQARATLPANLAKLMPETTGMIDSETVALCDTAVAELNLWILAYTVTVNAFPTENVFYVEFMAIALFEFLDAGYEFQTDITDEVIGAVGIDFDIVTFSKINLVKFQSRGFTCIEEAIQRRPVTIGDNGQRLLSKHYEMLVIGNNVYVNQRISIPVIDSSSNLVSDESMPKVTGNFTFVSNGVNTVTPVKDKARGVITTFTGFNPDTKESFLLDISGVTCLSDMRADDSVLAK